MPCMGEDRKGGGKLKEYNLLENKWRFIEETKMKFTKKRHVLRPNNLSIKIRKFSSFL